MAKKPETVFKERVLADLAVLPNSTFEKIQQVGKRGTPDILGACNGYPVAMELKKSAKDKPTKLQLHKLARWKKAYALVFTPCPENWDEIYKRLTIISMEGNYGTDERRRELERRILAES